MLRFAGLLGVLLMAKWNWGSLSKTRVGNVCGWLNDGAQGLHGPRGHIEDGEGLCLCLSRGVGLRIL